MIWFNMVTGQAFWLAIHALVFAAAFAILSPIERAITPLVSSEDIATAIIGTVALFVAAILPATIRWRRLNGSS